MTYIDPDEFYSPNNHKPREDRRNERIKMLEDRIQEIKQAARDEEELREQYPALQDAWEKYQIVLKTVK